MSYSISASSSNVGRPAGERLRGLFTGLNVGQFGSLISLIVFLGIWEAAVRTGLLPQVLVPPPSSVVPTFLREQSHGMWSQNVIASLRHYALGVMIGSVLGISLGVASGFWPIVQKSQEGVARLLRPIPPIAWIPFAIIWFGVTEAAAAFIIGIGVFWFNYFASYTAVKGVDKSYIELANAFSQGGFFNRLTKIILPGAAPGIFSGLRAGLGMGWVTVLAAELFGIPGIGQRMMEAGGLLATDVVVLYMVTIAALYSLCDITITFISKSVLQWQE
ncbi:ABC transporter permease [Pseudorhodoplanes sp.]|uniref:ABC transporter permease n=1 Tax=Pseudorhodoplanes sp. TaxID=1934341 RepID=UPI003D13C1D1